MKIGFYPLDVDYENKETSTIKVFGRTTEGKKIELVDDSLQPYFWATPKKNIGTLKKNIEKLKDVVKAEIEEKKFYEQPIKAIKITAKNTGDLAKISTEVRHQKNVEAVFETDINFTKRYLIDKDIIPLQLYEIETEEGRIKKITPKEGSYDNPKIIAFDIETYFEPGRYSISTRDPIISLAMYGERLKKVITWKKFPTEENITFVDNEAELIKEFIKTVKEYDADYIIGYFSDGFDMPYIRTRAEKNKINLDKGLKGLDISRRRSTKAASSIIHIDIFSFISTIMGYTLKTENFDLDSVARELIGEGKEKIEIEKMGLVWDSGSKEIEDICIYNLKDAEITYKLCNKIIVNLNELTKVIGQPIFDISRLSYGQLVDWYLIRKAKQYNEICPNRPYREKIIERMMQEKYKGAFVYDPKPGLYENLALVDFKGMYPSIIVSYNISPTTITNEKKGSYETPEIEHNGNKVRYYFTKKEGFITKSIKEIILKRNELKKTLREKFDKALEGRSYALKTVGNSAYGYMGFFGARWYSRECAESITAFARYYIQRTIEEAKKEFEVIYGDSLPPERKIIIQNNKGEIRITQIGDFVNQFKTNKYVSGYKTLTFDGKKLVFAPIKRAIKHKCKQKEDLLEFITTHGKTIVTPQHSIYTYDQKIRLIDAKNLKEGEYLISLTNPPIKEIFKENHVFDITRLDFGPYKNKLYLYYDKLIFKKEKKAICPYCKRMVRLPNHIKKCHESRKAHISFNNYINYDFIGGKNTKSGRIPRYWKLTKELAWLLGYYSAEGSASERNLKHRKEMISFGSQDKKLIRKVKRILDDILEQKLQIIEYLDKRTNKKMYYYRVSKLPILGLFIYGFDLGKGSAGKRVPWFILNSDETIKKSFLKGYLDGDGTVHKDPRYRTHFKKVTTKSYDLAVGLQYLFKSLKHKEKNYYKKTIEHIYWGYRKDKPGIIDIRFQSVKGKPLTNFCLARIKKINKIQYKGYVYDLEVKNSHNFVDAEGLILVHNTDSIVLNLNNKTKNDVLEFTKKINDKLPGIMELELEEIYTRGIFVTKKGEVKTGAKKKYVLLNEKGELIVKGFEAIRRDWSRLAKQVQRKVLEMVLKENAKEKAFEYVKTVIKDIRNKKFEIKDMVIRMQLQKNLSDYQSRGPHVAVAEKMREKGMYVGIGTTITYVITPGKGQIRDRARHSKEAEDYDAEYYINNQIIPAVGPILEVLGYKSEQLIEFANQKKLGDF